MNKENTSTEPKSVEDQVNKISELHLAKLQESNSRLANVNEQAAEIYQREFEIKQAKVALDNTNSEVLVERQKLINELTQTYGRVNINPMTGEFKNIE